MSAANPHPTAANLRAFPATSQTPAIVPVRRGMLVGLALGALGLVGWAGAATWFVLGQDQLAAGFLSRLTEREQAYEDRIGTLRTRLDRVTSQKLVEQAGLDARLAEVAARQKEIEARQAVLARLIDHGPARPQGAAAPSEPSGAGAAAPAAKPAPLAESLGLRLGTDGASERPANPGSAGAPEPRRHDRLSRIEQSVRDVETIQLRTVEAVRRAHAAEAARLKLVLDSLRLPRERFAAGRRNGLGGPLVPLADVPVQHPFEVAAARAESSLGEIRWLREAAAALPTGRPAPGDTDLTSGFGMRIDPFTRGLAMHTGLDFRAEPGDPVRATAAGRVTTAEYSGGYGRMVEIDHGNGLSTRYAHLSSIRVAPDQIVAAGAVVGRVGSSGRSTGPHLHYETRVEGVAVDPLPFLRAGARLRGTALAAAAD